MDGIFIVGRIFIWEEAKQGFKFPTKNDIRMSFWLNENKLSTSSEIKYNETSLDIRKEYVVIIMFGNNRPELRSEIIVGKKFSMGLFPTRYISGKILKIISLKDYFEDKAPI